jgi:hypothetical protein
MISVRQNLRPCVMVKNTVKEENYAILFGIVEVFSSLSLQQILCKIKLFYIFSLLRIKVQCPETEYKNYLHLALEILLQDSDLLLESPESSCNIMHDSVHRYAAFFFFFRWR